MHEWAAWIKPYPRVSRRLAGQPKEVVWSILGHTYWLKAECDGCFIFETQDPPGTFVPPHIHPTQDEFIYMLEGTFHLYLDGSWNQARTGDLVRMPKGLPHAYYNKQDKWRGHCSRLRLRDVYVSCSINSTILPIPMRWFAARRSARLISCRPAQCLGHELKTVFLQNLPILRKIW